MNKQKIENILLLSDAERYSYFIRKIVDFEEVWGLYDSGWATSINNAGKIVVPFWSEKEFAQICSSGKWANYVPKSVALTEFKNKWLTGMKHDGYSVNIFLTPKSNIGLIVEPDDLLFDIIKEEDKYL